MANNHQGTAEKSTQTGAEVPKRDCEDQRSEVTAEKPSLCWLILNKLGCDAGPKPVASRKQTKWKRVVGKIVRWAFLFVLFVYLLALAMLLFEIDAFQTLVAQLGASITDQGTAAGNTRQREILQAVRVSATQSNGGASAQARSDQERIPEAERQLYLQVAAKIDPLRAAINSLADIGASASFQLRTDETYARTQRDAFRELTGRIGRAVDDVQQKIKSLPLCRPGRADDSSDRAGANSRCVEVASKPLVTDLVDLQRAVSGLRDFIDFDDQATEGPEEAEEGRRRRWEKATIQVAGLLNDLKQLLADLTGADTRRESGVLAAMTERTEDEELIRDVGKLLPRLEERNAEEVMAQKLASFKRDEDTDKGASGEPEDSAPKLPDLSDTSEPEKDIQLRRTLKVYGLYKKKPKIADVKIPESAEAGVRDDNWVQAVEAFQTSEGIGVDGAVGPETLGRLNTFIEICNKSADCVRYIEEGYPVEISGELVRLRSALVKLKASVSPYIGDFKRVSKLTQQLANIEVASRRLEHLEVDVEQNPFAGESAEDNLVEARRLYQKETLDLAKAIKEIRRTLRQSDAAIIIADAIGDQDPLAHRKAVTILREFEAFERYEAILIPLSFLACPPPECGRPGASSKSAKSTESAKSQKSKEGDSEAHDKSKEDGPEESEESKKEESEESDCCYTWVAFINRVSEIGFRPEDMATMTRQALDIMVVLVMGAIGSLIYLIKYLLAQILLRSEEGTAMVRPLSWYLFRPLFGIVVAFAIYLLYKTGQVALGGSTGNTLSSDVNLPILSIFSLFAGLLSWQALEMVESKGRRWLSAQRRDNLWAAGLNNALRNAGKTINDCASQVGVTPTQVDRWIAGQDKVTPEMQDRITTWLNRDRDEVFGDTNPRDIDEGTLRWATGLKGALKRNTAGIDEPRLAQMIGQDVTSVHAWAELKRQVDQEMQFLIAEKLGEPRDKLFTEEPPGAEVWAVCLRAALKKGAAGLRISDDLARAIGSTPQQIRSYMELKASVPQTEQNLMAEALAVPHDSLFSADLPRDTEFKWAAKLRECMRSSDIKDCSELAEKIDTEAMWVRSWMEQDVCGEDDPPYCGQVAPETQRILAETLTCAPETLFRAERAVGDFRWVVMPRFEELVNAAGRGGIGGLASRLDLDVPRIERWMSYSEAVAPETQLALLSDLGLPVEERDSLFTIRPPVDPERREGVWWATGLREAVRDHPDYRGLADLAAQLEVPVKTLFDQVEMLEPVPMDLRDRIMRLLGPASPSNGPLFSNKGPDWTEFCWAPRLREALEKAELGASELAEMLDIDEKRVRCWMEMDDRDAEPLWAKGKVNRGQVGPATREKIRLVLRENFPEDQFSKTRSVAGLRYAVRPTFGDAVNAFDGKLEGFAEQVDVAPDRVRRWIDQAEQVVPATKKRILDVFGLDEEVDEGQLFSPEPRDDDAQG